MDKPPSDLNHTYGIVLCATGDFYHRMATLAIRQILRIEPDVPIELFTENVHSERFSEYRNISNLSLKSIRDPAGGFSDKIKAISDSEFDKIIYMDVDMLLVRPIVRDLLLALRDVDLIVRTDMDFNLSWEFREYSPAIPQPNTGLIGLNRWTDKGGEFIQSWLTSNRLVPKPHDQPTFRKAMLNTRINLAHLGQEFNCMPTGILYYPPRVFHFTSDAWKRKWLNGSAELSASLNDLNSMLVSGDFSVVFHADFSPRYGFLAKSNRWVHF